MTWDPLLSSEPTSIAGFDPLCPPGPLGSTYTRPRPMPLLTALFFLVNVMQAPAPSSEVWPPAGVLTVRDGIVPPKAITSPSPTYTREGARRRIQGFVTLQFVVEPDGTVGPVRVIRSLDAASGLDDAAVGTLRQWRFTPGTKDGRPVRVMATIVMTYSFRDLPPPMTLPEGFSSASDIPGRWSTTEVTSNNVQIQFQYPDGWALETRPGLAAAIGRPATLQSVGIYRPSPVARPLPFPMPVAELMRFSEFMKQTFASQARQVEVLAVGQSPLGPTNWLWLELDVREGRGWAFTTNVGTQAVQVICLAATARISMTEAERVTALAGARTDCASILKRMVFTAR